MTGRWICEKRDMGFMAQQNAALKRLLDAKSEFSGDL
jgi:cytidylate kinase